MICSRGEVHVWRVGLDCIPPVIVELRATLSPEERVRARRFHGHQMCNRWTAARGALRRIVGEYAHRDPASLEFRVGTYGKPELVGEPGEIAFSLSHSRNMALVAVVNSGRVGVDAEHVDVSLEFEKIIERSFAQEERDDILALPRESRRRAFFATWTRKEAFVKATGQGLSLPMDRFAVSVNPDQPARLISVDGDDAARWSLMDIGTPDVAAAIAVDKREPVVQEFQFAMPVGRELQRIKSVVHVSTIRTM